MATPNLAGHSTSAVTAKPGDVVVLVMRGVSMVYLAKVTHDGETLDTLKTRFTSSMRAQALAAARAVTAETGGRILRWSIGASGPELWPE